MKPIFKDGYQPIEDYGTLFLVECPQCEGCARVEKYVPGKEVPSMKKSKKTKPPKNYRWHYRLICVKCGYNKTEYFNSQISGIPTDWFFRRPLWLQIPCCGEVLWAYNAPHLAFLKSYVQAELREDGIATRTVATRLPTWLKSAKNRAEILHGIEKLEAKLQLA
ncbi:MAG: hypothetical protein WCS37_16795 [Chloroflexota bacterium]|nr:hypothetical protein [Chloroflexota bacterium]